MIKGFSKNGLLTDAFKLFSELEDKGCPPNEISYNTIIKGFLNANVVGRALELVQNMRSHGFASDVDTTTLFLGLLTSHNVSDTDKALLQKFLEHDGDEKRMHDVLVIKRTNEASRD